MRECKDYKTKRHNDALYYEQIKNLGIRNVKVPGEEAWENYWSGFSIKPNPIYYRMFREYVGDDCRIVPEDICRIAIESCLNPERFRGFYHDKNSWDLIFSRGTFPETFFRCIDGIYYDAEYNMLCDFSEKDFIDMLKKMNFNKFAVKPTRDTNSSQGFNTINLADDKFVFGCNSKKKVTLDSLKEFEGDNYIIQPFMKQSSYISQFCESSVNPIRIQTYRSIKDGKVHILPGTVLRVGFKGEENDGTHGNGKIIGIDNDTGKLSHEVLDYNGNIQTEFNGVDYKNDYYIPNFELIKEKAIKVAEKVIHHRLLAFDIMLDSDNCPIVFEFNIDYYSMWISQFTGYAAFGLFTDEIVEYTKTNIKKTERVLLI